MISVVLNFSLFRSLVFNFYQISYSFHLYCPILLQIFYYFQHLNTPMSKFYAQGNISDDSDSE